MKMNKWILPLAIALVATVAATGCKKGPTKITGLPGQRPAPVGGDTGGGTLPPGSSIDNGPGSGSGPVSSLPGNLATAEIDLSKYDQDRAALAAYTVHFAFDSSVVKSSDEASVSAVAAALAGDANAKLLIEGHCDERGTEEYNRALGERRALALREALQKQGLDSSRVKTISYGKDKPAVEGHDEAAYGKNRRGEFILLHPKAGA
jgi:peptidoglycan-associated lipoprotein